MRIENAARMLALVLGILVAVPEVVAQQMGKVWRIGSLVDRSPEAGEAIVEAFRDGLRQAGYTEGRDIVIEYRWTHGKAEAMPGMAAELVQLNVDVIFAAGTVAASAARGATKTIPIVFAAVGDPVGAELVTSLSRPGGNVTGLSSANVELVAKRLQLLKDVSRNNVSRVGVLVNPQDVSNLVTLRELEGPARRMGVTLVRANVRGAEDFMSASQTMASERVHALFVPGGALMGIHAKEIVALADRTRLPAIYSGRQFVEIGGLMSYAVNFFDQYHRAGVYVDKILKGSRPAGLPVEQPDKFELVINMRTARALGLVVPPSLLLSADSVIE